jgi:mono/diheme cytochrome c family protein
MKCGWLATVGAAVLLLSALQSIPAQADRQAFGDIQRGKELTDAGDCIACHSSADGRPFVGGFRLQTPFGTLLGANLTPDRETGIGAWTDDEFIAALQKGIRRDGAHLYPGMPYAYFTKISRADALAIRAYLNSLPPVRNAVESNQLPFPFNMRMFVAVWDRLYLKQGRFQPVVGKSDEWNRGAYLVQGLGHCGMCHTDKTRLGGDTGTPLAGGELVGSYAPDLTANQRSGLGAWSVDDIVAYLHTGHNGRAPATGQMAEVIRDSTSKLPVLDLHAMAVYLKDFSPANNREAPPQIVAANDPAMQHGQAVYQDNCAACHGLDGAGEPVIFIPLRGNAIVQQSSATDMIAAVLQGTKNVGTGPAPTGPAMPSFAWRLSNNDIADVLTYVRNSWGNHAATVSAGDVKSQRNAQEAAR